MALQNLQIDLHVFATDIDPRALQKGRSGSYPRNIVADVTPRRLKRFFKEVPEGFEVSERVRQSCVFAAQNLIADPPFSKLDIISCRNLLIYLQPPVQRRLTEIFHFALQDDGLLILGSSESVAKGSDFFKAVDSKSRIFRKVDTGPVANRSYSSFASTRGGRRQAKPTLGSPKAASLRLSEAVRSRLIEEFAPAAVVVNRKGEVLFYSGPVRRYLDFPNGGPSTDISITARRVGEGRNDEKAVMLTFEDVAVNKPRKREARSVEAVEGEDQLNQLEHELQATRDDLQATIETLETSNEELQASNEEVMSMNEEFQATNQELETSREELQSLNEELSTVNTQLEDTVKELEDINNDLQNLLRSTAIPTIFLSTELEIRRFSDTTTDIFHLLPGDIGRPITDFKMNVADPNLVRDAKEVLKHLAAIERRVTTDDGHWYLRRTLPYRTSEDRIQGAVITYADVQNLHEAMETAEMREAQHRAAAAIGSVALSEAQPQEVFELAVDVIIDVLGMDCSKVLELLPGGKSLVLKAGRGWSDQIIMGKSTVSTGHNSQAGYTLNSAAPVICEDLRTEKRFSSPRLLTDHGVVSGMSVIIGSPDDPWGVLGAHTKAPRKFTVDDVSFLQTIAHVLASTVQRARDREIIAESQSNLARRYAELEVVFEQASVGLALMDSEGRYLRVNEQILTMNGVPREATLGRTIDEVVPEIAEGVKEIVKRVASTRISETQVSFRASTPADPKTKRYWMVDYHPIVPDGEEATVLALVSDVTEETRLSEAKSAKAQVAAALAAATHRDVAIEQVARAMADNLHITVSEWWTRDEDSGLLTCLSCKVLDPGTEEKLPADWSQRQFKIGEGLIGGTWERGAATYVRNLSDDPRFHRAGPELQLLGSGFAVPVPGPDRTEAVLAFFSPLILTDGADFLEVVERIGLSVQQFRKRLRADAALRDALGAEAAANRAKSEFLANMSHEIRTPMTAILGFTDFFAERVDEEELLNLVEVIRSNGRQLLAILDDILDLSRVEAGQFELHRESFSPEDLVEGVARLMAMRMEEKGLVFSVRLEAAVPHVCEGDALRIRQVLINLMSNAAKFTPDGEVALVIRFDRWPEPRLVFRLEDTGIGVAEAEIERLFEAFYQVDSSDRRANSGTGLGLTISRRLAELLGGDLSVESTVGQGSTFTFRVPVHVDLDAPTYLPPSPTGTPAASAELTGRFLVAEDHNEVATLLRDILVHAGANDVVVVRNGVEAVAAVTHASNRDGYEAVIMDMQMPEMDGYRATETIRAAGYSGPIVAVTARAMRGDSERSHAAGCDVHLTKPIDRTELITTLSRLVDEYRADQPREGAPD